MEDNNLKVDIPKAIRDLPIKTQCEFLQLSHNLRKVVEITVIPEQRDTTLSVIDTLKNAGYVVAESKRDRGISEFYVSREPELAAEAAGLSVKNQEDTERFGELMGFPKAAIEAYSSGEDALLSQDEEREMLGFDNILFPFRLSKKHYKEEIEYLRKCYQCLLDQTPYLLDELFSEKETAEKHRKSVEEFVGTE